LSPKSNGRSTRNAKKELTPALKTIEEEDEGEDKVLIDREKTETLAKEKVMSNVANFKPRDKAFSMTMDEEKEKLEQVKKGFKAKGKRIN